MSCAGFLWRCQTHPRALESRAWSGSQQMSGCSGPALGPCLSDGEMLLQKWGKKAFFRVWPPLCLCHPHCTYTTSSSFLPHPHRTQFLVCGLYLFGFAFFLVVLHAELSGSLVSWEVFWSMGGICVTGTLHREEMWILRRRAWLWAGNLHSHVLGFSKYQLKLSAWKKNTLWNSVLMLSLPYLHTGNPQFDTTDFSVLMKSMEQIPFRLYKLKDIFSPDPLTLPGLSFLPASVKFSLICSILWF